MAQQQPNGFVRTVAQVASATGSAFSSFKDGAYDLIDAIDDRLQPDAEVRNTPAARPVDSRQKTKVVARRSPLDVIGSTASSVKDVLYGSVETIIETPQLLKTVQTRAEYERAQSSAARDQKRTARVKAADSMSAAKDALWDTVETVENIGTTLAQAPAAISAAVSNIQSIPAAVQARVDSTTAAVTRTKASVTGVVDTISGKKRAEKAKAEAAAQAAR